MDKIKEMFTDLKDHTTECTQEEVNNGKLMAVLAYFGLLALIPYFVEKDNKYIRFHSIQGLNFYLEGLIATVGLTVVMFVSMFLFIIPILGWILGGILFIVSFIGLMAISIGSLVFQIMGIVYAVQGSAKELPIVNKLKLIKK